VGEGEAEFQRLVATLDYPIYIVTVSSGDHRAGCVVGFASQCSIHPPRYWVCISTKNHSLEVAMAASTMVVHVPAPDQHDLVRLFAEETGDETDKFARVSWEPGPDGTTPVLSDCDRWFSGPVLERFDSGDHVSFLIQVAAASAGHRKGQFGFQEAKDMEPGHEP
jgi:flavin reductase (DIM6/NTAB) family NADH-FMN oxidoreductase RutF